MEGTYGLIRFLRTLKTRSRTHNTAVACVQEHMLPKGKHEAILKTIRSKNYDAVITYGKADNPDSTRGGVMVIWDTKVLKLTQTLDEMPGFIRVNLDWAGQPLEVASVYAPSESGVKRIDFFNKIEKTVGFF